jgi:hypothetical protein
MSADNIAALTLIFVVIVRSPSQNNVLHISFNFEDTDALAYASIYSHRIKMSD